MCMRCLNYLVIWQKSIKTYSQAKKKVVYFPEIRRVKSFLSLTTCKDKYVSECTFLSSKSNKQTTTKKQESKKAKETNEEKGISPESRSEIFKKFVAARVMIFLVTCISRNKGIMFFGLSSNNTNHNN